MEWMAGASMALTCSAAGRLPCTLSCHRVAATAHVRICSAEWLWYLSQWVCLCVRRPCIVCVCLVFARIGGHGAYGERGHTSEQRMQYNANGKVLQLRLVFWTRTMDG